MSTLQPASPTTDGGPARTGRALARCVRDPAAFAAVWGREALFTAAAELPESFDDLLDLAGIDELLSRRGLRSPFLRMAKDGVVVPASSFTRSGGVGATVADQVDSEAVASLFAEGTTIVLQALHRVWPPLLDFAAELTAELGHPVQVNAYVTPPSSRGFSAHYDVHDVFVLQLAGEKRWIVHQPALEAPLRSQPWTERRRDVEHAAKGQPVLDVVLRTGDTLYLPRGFVHSAEALGHVSAHLTVGIHVITRHAVVEELVTLTRDHVDVRRSLPLGLDLSDPGAAAEVAATISELRRILEEIDETAVLHGLQATLAAMTPTPAVSPLANAASAERP